MQRIMILDRSSVIRKVAKRILSDDSSVISEAETGREALDKCRVDLPDAIICDHMLDDMTTVEFIAHVKTIAGDNMPKILVNLHEMDLVAIMKSKRAGAAGFLLKPFNRSLLLDRFAELNKAAA